MPVGTAVPVAISFFDLEGQGVEARCLWAAIVCMEGTMEGETRLCKIVVDPAVSTHTGVNPPVFALLLSLHPILGYPDAKSGLSHR